MANKADYILEALGLKVDGKELSVDEIGKVFKDFREVKKVLDDYEKKTLKPYFFSGAEQFGSQTESGGHRVVLADGSGWEKQARVKVAVDEVKALEILKEKSFHDFIDKVNYIPEENTESVITLLQAQGREDLFEAKESVTNDSLEQLYLEGKLSDEELSELISRKVTYALVEVKPKKK